MPWQSLSPPLALVMPFSPSRGLKRASRCVLAACLRLLTRMGWDRGGTPSEQGQESYSVSNQMLVQVSGYNMCGEHLPDVPEVPKLLSPAQHSLAFFFFSLFVGIRRFLASCESRRLLRPPRVKSPYTK